jgi:hypothetical protein
MIIWSDATERMKDWYISEILGLCGEVAAKERERLDIIDSWIDLKVLVDGDLDEKNIDDWLKETADQNDAETGYLY